MNNSKFDLSKPRERDFDLTKDTSEPNPVPPTPPSPNKWKRIAGISALAAVLGGAGIAGYHQLKDTDPVVSPDSAAIVSDTVNRSEPIDSIETIPIVEGDAAVKDESAPEIKEQSVEQTEDKAKAVDNVSDNTSSAKTTIQGTVDELALRVIRGDYGNNPVRRKKLGDRYQEIQDKVNQMYREGKVR